MELINETLQDALIEQWGKEIYNSHLYLYVASYLNGKGLSNLASLFSSQHKEEQEHAGILYNLLSDLNVVMGIPFIDEISTPINSISDIANLYLEREIETTSSLNDIKVLSQGDESPIVEQRIREMILLQQHEMKEATDFKDKSEILSDWKSVALWDISLGK